MRPFPANQKVDMALIKIEFDTLGIEGCKIFRQDQSVHGGGVCMLRIPLMRLK